MNRNDNSKERPTSKKDDSVRSQVDKVIDELRLYKRSDLVHASLHMISKSGEGQPFIPPWTYLTIMTWAMMHSNDILVRKPLGQAQFKVLTEGVFELMNQHEFADFNKHGEAIFKVLAFQQFRYQRHDFMLVISRNLAMFTKWPTKESERISKAFEDRYGLSIERFLRMVFVTIMFAHTTGIYSLGELFDHTTGLIFTNQERTAYKEMLTLNIHQSDEFVQKVSQRVRSPLYQTFDNEQYFVKPLIQTTKGLFTLDESVLTNTAESFVYRFAREQLENGASVFGDMFEKYLQRCLDDSRLAYVDEGTLKKRFPNGKVVDFLLEENVLVESKAVEMSASVSVFPSSMQIARSMKDSLFKAYCEQMMTIANKLPKENQPLYGLIVTYRIPYLGRLEDYWEGTLKLRTTDYCNVNGLDAERLPLTNVSLISVGEFEHLVLLCKSTGISVSEVLKGAVVDNGKRDTSTMNFNQHLEKYDGVDLDGYLSEISDDLKETVNLDKFLFDPKS